MSVAAAPLRGFTIDRSDGQRPLPGSLHGNRRLDRWLSLAEPGVMLVRTGKVELGQGILTALQLIVAEELDLPLSAVRLLPATTAAGPDEGVTSGSLSVQDSGGALRHACAELRGLALERAGGSQPLRVEAGRVLAPDGRVLGDYWSLLSDADLDREYEGRWAPKVAAERRLMGRARPERLDLADKVFGTARYVHDLRPPGLLHGRVLRAPTLLARLASALPALPEPLHCWADGNFVAVMGESERKVEAAAERVRATLQWQPGPPLPDQATLPDFLRSAESQATVTAERGQPGLPATDWATPPPGGTRHTATYFKPYLAHASIGPSCALALWQQGRLTVWTHSQSIHNLRDDLLLALQPLHPALRKQDIEIHHVEGAGCYGHNGADDVACDAALMALRAEGRPVRVLWSRADELAHGPLGPAHRVELQAQVDEEGHITHWQHETWANGYSSRPGRAKVPALLAASQREGGAPLPLAINPPLGSGGGAERNAVPGYTFAQHRIVTHRLLQMPLRTSAMRALGAFANVFAIESFIDEIALARGEDALALRRRHLQHDARALAVLDTAIERSTWWNAPEQPAEEGESRGRGLAWARYKNTGAWCAVLARVQVGESVRVLDLDLAVDVGMVVDRDGVINQIEGGALQAMSWTLKEQVTFDAEGVTGASWEHYRILRFSELPRSVVHVIDRPEEPPLGAGEAAQGPVAGALANAVAAALGIRVRALPLSPANILAAMEAA